MGEGFDGGLGAEFDAADEDGRNGWLSVGNGGVPTEAEIKKMVWKLTPRLVRPLPTPESITQFLCQVTAALQPSKSKA